MNFIYHNEIDNLVIKVFPDLVAAFYVSKAERGTTGYVWLFNLDRPAGQLSEEDSDDTRFRNPSENCYPHHIKTPIVESDFEVNYAQSSKKFGIYFRGKLVGVLGDHDCPGKSSFAQVDSPAALTMGEELPRPT